jgi:hypothetical protein
LISHLPTPFVFGDEYLYTSYAKDLLQNPLTFFAPDKGQLYPPGYPLILVPGFLFYPSIFAIYQTILGINILVSTSILFISFLILKIYISNKEAFLGSILIATLPLVTLNNYIIFSENFYFPALILACLLFLWSIESDNQRLHFFTGFVIGFLPLIRAFGILAVFSFFMVILYQLFIHRDSLLAFLAEKKYLIIVPLATFGIYTGIKTIFSSDLYGYNSVGFLENLIWIIHDLPSLLTFFRAFAAELDYLIITTYIGFFIFTTLLILFWKRLDDSLKNLFLFTFFYTIFSIFITILHMLTFLRSPDSPFFPQYLMFGRYLDPATPLMFILGIVFLYKYLPEFDTGNFLSGVASRWRILVPAFMGLGAFFIMTYPTELKYKLVNVSTIYYLDYLSPFSPYLLFLVPLVFIILCLLLVRRPSILIVVCIIISILITIPAFNLIEKTSRNTGTLDTYGIIARDHGGSTGNIIFLDKETFKDPNYAREYYLIKYWGLADEINTTDSFSDSHVRPDYIISTRILSFPVISFGPHSLIVYKQFNSTDYSLDSKIQTLPNNTWITDNTSILFWNPPQKPRNYTLNLKIATIGRIRTLMITANNATIYQGNITPNIVKDVLIPVNLPGGLYSVRLASPEPCIRPSEISQSPDQRCLSFKIINASFEPG